MGCNGQPMWLPGESWNLGGFQRALEMTVRLSGTNSECSFRARMRQIRLADAHSYAIQNTGKASTLPDECRIRLFQRTLDQANVLTFTLTSMPSSSSALPQ